MQVSDLDGTMVGESPAADAATAQFYEYWENTAALAGGVLVYNTGRSLGQFQELLASKAAMLALPNALITAVGTKVLASPTAPVGPCMKTRLSTAGCCWMPDAHMLAGGCGIASVSRALASVLQLIQPRPGGASVLSSPCMTAL